MKKKNISETVYKISDSVVVRHVEGEQVLIPAETDIYDEERGLYTLNSSAQAIWKKLDGKKSIKKIVDELSVEYHTPARVIAPDVIELVGNLFKRKLVVEKAKG